MENYYTAYTKELQNRTFYFVKWYLKFPELKNVPPLLKGYGMHTDFNKACRIALVNNNKIKEQLLQEIKTNVKQAKIIELNNDLIVNRKVKSSS